MNAHIASLVNGIVLVVIGLWGYMESSSPTSLIPVVIGAILLVLNKGVKNQNKVIAHLAVLATFICLIGLFMPLNGAIERGNDLAVARVSAMIASSVIALIFFIKSFIEARRKG